MYSWLAHRTLVGLALVSVLSISSILPSQGAKIERDVAFVRALAKDLGFISLAQEETNRLQRVYEASSDFQHVAQLGIEISLVGARLYANRGRQRTLFREAINRCKELLEAYPEGTVAQAARLTLGDACYQYGRFLVEELELSREEAPELVPSLEGEAADIFRTGVDACEKAMRELRPDIATDPDKRLQHGVTWLRKGILLREHGRAVRRDRTALCAFAKNTLEDLIFEVGEETALGLRGLFEYAQCDEVLGNRRDAEDLYRDTIEQLITSLEQAEELELTSQNMEFLFDMMQEIYDRLATLQFESGDTVGILATAEEFRDRLRGMGAQGTEIFESAHERFGHSLFLTEARAQAESGQPDQVTAALAMVKRINDRHPNDIIGLKAKAVLKDILELQSNLVSGSLLFEVAKGEFQKQSYEEAIKGLRRALAAMSDAERSEHGLESYYLIGRAYRLQDRYLESVLALKKGLETHGTDSDTISQDMADRLDRAMRRLRRTTRNDVNFDGLNNQVLAVVASMGGEASANQMHWNRARQFSTDRNYARAAESFGLITPEFLRYDLAQSRRAIALRANKDYRGARRIIANFRAWTQTSQGEIPEDRADKLAIRGQSLAEVAYSEAFMLYNEATGGEEAGTEKNLTKYPAVIQAFQSFIAEHSRTGSNFLPRAHDILARMHTEIGEMALAEEAYGNLRQVDATKTLLPMLGTVLFTAYRTEIDNLEKEGTNPETLRELEQVRRKALTIGLEYAHTAPRPSYGMLYNSVQIAQALEDWQILDELARQAIDLYGQNPEYTRRVDAFLRPAVGRAALEERKFQQAYDMLVAAEQASPNNYRVKRLLALSLGGWLEFDSVGNAVPVLGLERPDEAYEIYWTKYRPYALSTQRGVRRYSLQWYEFHWEVYWFALKATTKDSAYVDRAQSIYNIARSIDDFAHLRDDFGQEGRVLWQKFTQNKPPRAP